MVDPDTTSGPHIRDMVSQTEAPGTQCRIGISGSSGVCPLGFMEEDVWSVDELGNLSFPLCVPAVEALRPVLIQVSEGRDFDTRAECQCPHADCRVSFVVHCPKLFETG